MQLKTFAPYYNTSPNTLDDTSYTRLVTYFNLLQKVENPMVSLVIPVYRAADTLICHILSLSMLKTILPYEVLFIDNNADIKSIGILEQFGATIIKETRQGITHARQKGLELAKGQVVLTMDPDTLYEPHYIDKMAIPFYFDANLVLCYSISKSYEDKMACSSGMHARNFLKSIYFKIKLAQKPEKRMKYIRAACLAVRKQALINVGGYRTDIKAVAGCDDGILAIDLNNSGSFKFVSTQVYTALPPKREPGKPFPFCNERFLTLDRFSRKLPGFTLETPKKQNV